VPLADATAVALHLALERGAQAGPGGGDRVTAGHIRLLTIPVSVRRTLWEHLSLNHGISLDVNASANEDVSSRSGLDLGAFLRVRNPC
jgi:hypothetical protein